MRLSIKKLEEMVAKVPDDLEIRKALANRYMTENKHSKALALLQEAAELDPENHEFYQQIGLYYAQTKKFSDARNYFVKALDRGGDKSILWGLIGVAGRQTEQKEMALHYLEKAYKSGNHHPQLCRGLAMERHLQGRLEEAVTMARHAVDDTPDLTYGHILLESLLSSLNRKKKNAGADSERRIAMHTNRVFHYSIFKPIFDELSKVYNVIMTNDPHWIADFDPDYVFVADAQTNNLKKFITRAKFIFTRHGLANKNVGFNSAEQCDYVCLSSSYLSQIYIEKGDFHPDQLWVVGYAQMDNMFRDVALPIPEKIATGNKTILYAPTFNEDISSVPMLGPNLIEKIRGVQGRHNIIIKPHPLIYDFSPNWITWFMEAAKTQENVFLVADKAADVIPYLKNADILLTDASSVMFEYLPMDRPIILLNNPERTGCPQFNPDAIEWKWRDVGVEVDDVELLSQTIENELANPARRKDKRELYSDRLFGDLRQGETGRLVKEKIGELYDART